MIVAVDDLQLERPRRLGRLRLRLKRLLRGGRGGASGATAGCGEALRFGGKRPAPSRPAPIAIEASEEGSRDILDCRT